MFDLAPGAVIADDGDDGQVLAHHAFELHAVEAKGAVTVQDQYFLPGPGNLCRHGKACAGAKAAHGACIEPVAGFGDVDHPAAIAHNITTVAYHGCVLVDEVAYLAAEAHGMNGYGIRVHRGAVPFQAPAFLGADVGKPLFLVELPGGLGHLLHTDAHVSRESGGNSAVGTDILACQVEPDDIGGRRDKRRLAVIEAEVHARANGQDGIGPFQRFTPCGGEEQRVRRWQAATARAIEKDGSLDALRKFAQWFGGVTPPDSGASHDDRALRFIQEGCRFVYKFRIGIGASHGSIAGRFTGIKKGLGIDEIIEDIHRYR